jgi:hydrogenase/urease accessory protein HupE
MSKIILLAAVAISLSVGLVLQYAHGQEENQTKNIQFAYTNDTGFVISDVSAKLTPSGATDIIGLIEN